MKFKISKKWCEQSAKLEAGHSVQAGIPPMFRMTTHKDPAIPKGWHRVKHGAAERNGDRFWGWHTQRWTESKGQLLEISRHESNFIIRRSKRR